ncbi:MAG TPA: peptidase M13 [Gammaproteobacteria bacterium]|jgi:putative endopeptidase|nr:peptidase M13 [Gammaproteobacteria bacterium]
MTIKKTSRLQILLACVYILLSACGENRILSEKPTAESANDKGSPLISGILLDHLNTSIAPGDDFFSYVNGAWLDKTEIPADKSRFGTFDLLRDKSQDDVRIIIDEAANTASIKGSDEQKVGDLYRSFMDIETRERLGIKPLTPALEKISAIADLNSLIRTFAWAGKMGISTPLGFSMFPDMADPTRYAIYAWQDGLGLPDREYYLDQDSKFTEIRTAYVVHIEEMFALADMNIESSDAIAILELETRLAEDHLRKEETRDMTKMYNPKTRTELEELSTIIPWNTLLEESGLSTLEVLVVGQPSYVEALDSILTEVSISKWKLWLRWAVLNHYASSLTSALDLQNFKFYSTTLSGTEEQRPMWRRGVTLVNSVIGELVGKVYVRKHFPPQAKERMLSLVNNLVSAYRESITQLEWMGEETRIQALDKLSKFTPKIGYPDTWKDYSNLDVLANDLFGNLQRAALVEHERALEKLNGPVLKYEWSMTPQTVNAYYNPSLNEIVFPAAILQPPFFDMTADDAVNYGAIGGVIGHEIGHGFDDMGSTFDGDGVLRNWWSDNDREEFENRTSRLVDQYNGYTVLGDLSVNGEFTLGENIGDLGGLSIAMKAYKMSLADKTSNVIDGFTGEQRVFIGWAQGFAGKYRDQALRQRIATDSHSPFRFRVNGVVRNIPEFYSAFNVTENEQLYLPDSDRVKIW